MIPICPSGGPTLPCLSEAIVSRMKLHPCLLSDAQRWIRVALLLGLSSCSAVSLRELRVEPAAGEPWWMRQTAMTPSGQLDLESKSWWPRAAALKTGESFMLDADPDAGPMLIRRERVTNRSRTCDAIVWIIDDDSDGSLAMGGDRHDDCYVADYDADGTVDRMVDYMDDDGDGKANEMDIRTFVGGELRSVWCGLDLDGDGHMWDVKGYEYSGNFFASDPYGDNMIYMNKFNPHRGEWVPISECPFAFFDTDGDGQSEIAVRVSASPLSFDPAKDPDYANDSARYAGPWDDVMRSMGAMNVRYSFDIDNLSGPKTPLHYDMGFNLVGAVPYDLPGDRHFNAKRRPPQTTRVIPHDRLRAFCDSYAAQQTGFTWHEQHDDTISIGDPAGPGNKDDDFRWEGVFWTWERRLMPNTGGPGQKWNVRREWSDKPSDRRRVYYSEIDRRIHLFGASEGWIQVGHFAGLPELGEIRMYDTDGNGYFDRWEIYRSDSPVPVRVTTVRNERTRDLLFDFEAVQKFYMKDVLPDAMRTNEQFLIQLEAVVPFEPAAALKDATQSGPENMRRYAQDVLRETHYQHLRRDLTQIANKTLQSARMDDLRKVSPADRTTTPNSASAWQLLRALEELDVAYGQGEFAQAADILTRLRPLVEVFAK